MWCMYPYWAHKTLLIYNEILVLHFSLSLFLVFCHSSLLLSMHAFQSVARIEPIEPITFFCVQMRSKTRRNSFVWSERDPGHAPAAIMLQHPVYRFNPRCSLLLCISHLFISYHYPMLTQYRVDIHSPWLRQLWTRTSYQDNVSLFIIRLFGQPHQFQCIFCRFNLSRQWF